MRSRLVRGLILGLAVLVLANVPAWAGKVIPLNLSQLTNGAEYIFEGVCTRISTGRDPDSQLLATWYTFQVLRCLKGKMDEDFVLKQYGGSDGDLSLKVPMVRYEVGEHVILFLYGKSRIGFSSAVGMQQGKFLVREAAETQVKYVTNGMPAMVVFENMPDVPPVLDEKGRPAAGMERLRSERVECREFLALVQRLVQEQEKSRKTSP